ncbi:hypothetical protein [Nocardioides sp. MH1]|uniref:DUF7948 domain-containing protein n=1 Tax=Nocardioides sp. MH1 TaxID=3242490 RepID=UPI00352064BD
MKAPNRRRVAAAVTVLALAPVVTTVVPAPALSSGVAAVAAPSSTTSEPGEVAARRAYATSPLAFETNRGQVDRRVKLFARGRGFDLFLTERGAVFDLRSPDAPGDDTERSSAAVVLDPVGAAREPRVVGRRHRSTTTSYFLGNDRSEWRRDVRTFDRARYQDLYPGIDLVFGGDRTGPEYDFLVSPGSDPATIRYRLRGAESLRIEDGALVATTAAGDFVHRAPVAFQRVDGHRRIVESSFRLRRGVVTFDVGAYDRDRPLVIDPDTDITYSTYLGGTGDDGADAVAVEDGDVYLTGYARSADFPTTTGAYDSTADGDSSVFVARMSPDGAGGADLVYSTFLGGSGAVPEDEEGLGIAVADGDVYLTGVTGSNDFPTTAGAFDTTFGGGTDGFLAKISPDADGAADLVYSTLLGGGADDVGTSVAVAEGDAYLTGSTESADLATTPGAYDTTLDGTDAFLVRISPDGNGADDLVYSSFLGESGFTNGHGIALDGGDAWVTGDVTGDFPTTAGAPEWSGGAADVFVARLSPNGGGTSDLVYSARIGGTNPDYARGIALDGGDVYLTGDTDSTSWPTTPGAHDRDLGYGPYGFVARLSPDGAGTADLVYSTFLDVMDHGRSIAVEDGDVYVAGDGVVYDKYDDEYPYGTVARLSTAGAGASDLEHVTYVSASSANGIAVADGVAYVTGDTGPYSLTPTPGAYDTTPNGAPSDAFLLRVDTPDNQTWPDGLIRRRGRADLGDDVYWTWDGQTAQTRVRRGREGVFFITAQNDDNVAGSLRIDADKSVGRKWRVRYYVHGHNITKAVDGGYETPVLAPGEQVVIKATLMPLRRARIGSLCRVKFFVSSQAGDDSSTDRVRAEARARRG